MSTPISEKSRWIYEGLWGVLSAWFKVPKLPPSLPKLESEQISSFKPSEGFLRYLMIQFWIFLVVFDLAVLVGWLIVTISAPIVGAILAIPALLLAVLPDMLAYVAVHLRYDSTWYVMTDRSMRIRRGIWIIHETTITFENVQNVVVTQGPLQKFCGIADVLVETAGGGGRESHGAHGGGQGGGAHIGLIEGIANAQEIRDLLMSRLKTSQSAGLGDETTRSSENGLGWSPQHIHVLSEIRNLSQLMANTSSSE